MGPSVTGSEKFCLRWNDFEANIGSAFRDLKEEKDFTDVTLACADNQVEAHKVILASSSPFFKRILKKNPHSHPLIYLKGIKLSDVEAVLTFIYQGEVNVEEDNLNTFLEVAQDLEVKGLVPGKEDHKGRSHMQSPFPRTDMQSPNSRIIEQSSAVSSDLQSTVQMSGQVPSQAMLEVSPSANNNRSEAMYVKVEDTSSAPVLQKKQQENELGSLNHHQAQDDGMQNRGEYGEGVELDLHGHSSRLTEGENKGKYQCNLCGQITDKKSHAWRHVESVHFPGIYEHECDQCVEKFDTKNKWFIHRSHVHAKKKSK